MRSEKSASNGRERREPTIFTLGYSHVYFSHHRIVEYGNSLEKLLKLKKRIDSLSEIESELNMNILNGLKLSFEVAFFDGHKLPI